MKGIEPMTSILRRIAFASVALLVFAVGCKKTPSPQQPQALPSAPVTSTAPAAPAALLLTSPPPLKKDVAAMPELAQASTPALQQINASLAKLDTQAKSMIKDCPSYSKMVRPTMLGPGYLSFWVNESSDCGAYPNVAISAFVFDLSTGHAVDWTKLVTGKGVSNYADSGADGKLGAPLALVYPALFAKYMQKDNPDADCHGALAPEVDSPQSFILWPEAKDGSVVVEPFDLPHVVQACANDIKLSATELKDLGFNQIFLNALAAAHQQPGSASLTTTIPQ
jgi:hypothetical protein